MAWVEKTEKIDLNNLKPEEEMNMRLLEIRYLDKVMSTGWNSLTAKRVRSDRRNYY